jgi:hypothetical protein
MNVKPLSDAEGLNISDEILCECHLLEPFVPFNQCHVASCCSKNLSVIPGMRLTLPRSVRGKDCFEAECLWCLYAAQLLAIGTTCHLACLIYRKAINDRQNGYRAGRNFKSRQQALNDATRQIWAGCVMDQDLIDFMGGKSFKTSKNRLLAR